MNYCIECEVIIKEIGKSEKDTGWSCASDYHNAKCIHQPERSKREDSHE